MQSSLRSALTLVAAYLSIWLIWQFAANGWPEELSFPVGTLHRTPALAVSLVGLPSDAEGKYTIASRGNATVVTVPVVSLAKLPTASVSSNMFVFKVSGVEIRRH